MSFLSQTDPQISYTLLMEGKRQRETINLIPSENYVSKAVLEAQGSFLTNKYAEGYPQRRYYGGCENMDVVESRLSSGLRSYFIRSMLMSKHIAGLRLIWQPTTSYWSMVTRLWV